MQRLIDHSTTVTHLHHFNAITWEAKLDLIRWLDFLSGWSGTSLILNMQWTNRPKMNLYTDASCSEGWGAFWSGRWLQTHWTPAQLSIPTVWKELFAIVNTLNFWDHLWTKRRILFYCDNRSIMDIWRKGSTCNTATMALVCLLYFAAHYHINVIITTHIPGVIVLLTLYLVFRINDTVHGRPHPFCTLQ